MVYHCYCICFVIIFVSMATNCKIHVFVLFCYNVHVFLLFNRQDCEINYKFIYSRYIIVTFDINDN